MSGSNLPQKTQRKTITSRINQVKRIRRWVSERMLINPNDLGDALFFAQLTKEIEELKTEREQTPRAKTIPRHPKSTLHQHSRPKRALKELDWSMKNGMKVGDYRIMRGFRMLETPPA